MFFNPLHIFLNTVYFLNIMFNYIILFICNTAQYKKKYLIILFHQKLK